MSVKSIFFYDAEGGFFDSHNAFDTAKNHSHCRAIIDALTDVDGSICVLYGGVEDANWYKIVVDQIKKSESDKVTFFIEDVIRLHKDGNTTVVIDQNMIRDSEWKSPELDLITKVIEETNIDYKIYHCENNADDLERKYNLKMEYFDLFLIMYNHTNVRKPTGYSLHFSYKASCFNNRYEPHRQLISNLLFQNSDVMLTYYDYQKAELDSLTGFDITKFDDDIRIYIENTFETFKNYRRAFNETFYKPVDFNHMINNDKTQNQTKNLLRNSFLNIATETRMPTRMPYISEKSLKPVHARKPFILLAPYRSLNLMKEYGFKTFDKWWDESYDDIEDDTLRFQSAYRSIQSVLDKSMEELESIYEEMLPILDHNRKNLKVMKWHSLKT